MPKAFQLEGLEWMLRRERLGNANGQGVLQLHPNWLQLVTCSGHILYLSRWLGCRGTGKCLGMVFVGCICVRVLQLHLDWLQLLTWGASST